MLPANPLSIAYAGGTKSMPRISISDYATEYRLYEATQEFQMKIRHSKESLQPNGRRMNRHNVDLTRTIYGVSGAPDLIQNVYLVYRVDYKDSLADAAELGAALTTLVNEQGFLELGQWQS